MHDYIIVGGGSAGCAIAARLSENPDCSVLLLEQGPRDWNPYIHMPVTYYKTAKGALLTRYQTEPQKAQGGVTREFVVGRVLGGGSSVNAMVYIRGCPEDYDTWAAEGCDGWSYRDVLPYFKRSEDNESFANEVHGQGGPLGVSDQRHTHYLTKAWIKACQDFGIPYNPDFNCGKQAGCGPYQITARDGRRSSAATAYLRPAAKRSNLTVRTGVKVLKVLIEKGRAVGVQYLEKGRTAEVLASTEVIVSAGAIASPQLLMLSGIGPAMHLREMGVPVVHDLPGVGQNLQDHFDVFMVYDLNGPHSYDKYKKPHWQMWAGLQYLLFRNGPVTSNVCEGGLFWYGDRNDPLPNLQYVFLPGAGVEEGGVTAPSGNGLTVNMCQTRPRSRGEVKLKSADPMAHPSVDPNYLSEPYDLDVMAEGVGIGQDILSRAPIAKFITGPVRPVNRMRTAGEREDFVRTYGQGALHPSGTCKMGTDGMAVVDPQLRVRGIDGLRVADISILPRIVSGNTNAPAMMIGERAADFIRGNRPFRPA